MSVPRGPCNLPVLREAWVNGIIDENTLVWGQGLIDWLPVKNVRTLIPMIRTVEGAAHLLSIIITTMKLLLLRSEILCQFSPACFSNYAENLLMKRNA